MEISNTQLLYDQYIAPVKQLLTEYRFRDAQFAFMELARLGNKFLADLEPWKLIKTDEKATAFILRQSTDLLLNIALLMEPFMPEASKRLLNQLAVGDVDSLKSRFWLESKWLSMAAGQQLNSAELLFQKIEDDVVDVQIQKLQSSLTVNNVSVGMSLADAEELAEIKPLIEFPDFAKIDLRVGTVIACEKVEKADKLLRLSVDLGETVPRTVVSEIAMHF